VPIYTIALGTAEGRVTVEDQFGQPVTLDVPPDTETLAQIAEVTGATAFDAPTAEDLRAVYDNLESRLGSTEEQQEVTAWFAAGALVLVVLAAGMSALWFGRLP
jgi:Ca-activated chloride channel family protein